VKDIFSDHSRFVFYIGVHDFAVPTQHLIQRRARQVRHHPMDDRTFRDVTLIQLDEPVIFNRYVSAVCLAWPGFEQDMTQQNVAPMCLSCGWGGTRKIDSWFILFHVH